MTPHVKRGSLLMVMSSMSMMLMLLYTDPDTNYTPPLPLLQPNRALHMLNIMPACVRMGREHERLLTHLVGLYLAYMHHSAVCVARGYVSTQIRGRLVSRGNLTTTGPNPLEGYGCARGTRCQRGEGRNEGTASAVVRRCEDRCGTRASKGTRGLAAKTETSQGRAGE